MRIDPSQLAEPLAHVLGAGRTDAAAASKAIASGATVPVEQQMEQVDADLVARMRAAMIADAANSISSVHEARQRVAAATSSIGEDVDGARAAQSSMLDATRVRDLLS